MKAKTICAVAMCSLMAVLVSGCAKVVTNEPEPVLELETRIVNVSYEGGDCVVEYYIENPVEGGTLQLTSSDEDWIVGLDNAGGIITFSVLQSEIQDIRNGKVSVAYIYGEGKSVSDEIAVSQEAAPRADAFVITVAEVTHNSVKADVVPHDKEMTYVVMTVGKDEYEAESPSEDDLFDVILTQYNSAAIEAGMSLKDFLSSEGILKSGDCSAEITDLAAETEYILFAVGMSYEGERISEFIFADFATVEAPVEEITFELVPDIDGVSGFVKITPSDTEVWYYSDVLAVSVFEESFKGWDDYAKYIWGMSFDALVNAGFTAEQAVEASCYMGEIDMPVYALTPETEYYVYAFALDIEGNIISPVSNVEFVTGN